MHHQDSIAGSFSQHKKTPLPSGQLEAPNYTQIPNVVFDYWMPRLQPTVFTILLCLCRKTFGWHKLSDSISKNQLIKATGLSKNTLIAGINELESLNLVIVKKSQDENVHLPNEYCLRIFKPEDVSFFEQENDQDLTQGGSAREPGVVQSQNQGVVQQVNPQKKDLTKEILTKEKREREAPAGADATPPPVSASPSSSKKEEAKIPVAEDVLLTPVEYDKLLAQYGKAKLDWMIAFLSEKKGSKGYKYKSDYKTMLPLGWVNKAYEEAQQKTTGKPKDSKLRFTTRVDTWVPDTGRG